MVSAAVRALVVLALCVATCVAVTSTWGRRESRDQLIYTENIFNASRPGQYVYRDINYPKVMTSLSKTITYMATIDQVRNGTGGQCSLWYGGPQQKYATIQCVSERSYGLNYRLEIYGK